MSKIQHFSSLAETHLPTSRPVHLALGMFDGVHRGHQAVIGAAVAAARADGGIAGVFTFSAHPSRLLRPQQPVRLILSRDARRQVLARIGVEFVIEQEFTTEFSLIEAADFIPQLLSHLPNLAGLYVGENWRFGRGRQGDAALLVAEAAKHGGQAVIVPRVGAGDEPISSSRIRTLIEAGRIAEANELLGYSYFCSGIIAPGRQLGRKIGFPTLNLTWEPELKPAHGVYAVSVTDDQGRTTLGVANYGLRPTVAETTLPQLEVHLLGETTLGPGHKISVHWLHFLRPEKKFAGVEELRAQIALDRQNALLFFARAAGAEK